MNGASVPNSSVSVEETEKTKTEHIDNRQKGKK
jgi:hypothetical protein